MANRPLGEVDRGAAEPPLDPGAVGLHEPYAGRVDRDRPRRARRDRAERLAVGVVADEQLTVSAQRDAGRPGQEADAQLRLGAGGDRLRPGTGGPGRGDEASEPAPRPAPRRVVRW